MNNATPPPLPPPRSGFVTVVGWIIIVVSGLAVPISGISFLMVAAHSYGTASADAMGFVTVVFGPPVSLVAGIGLLRRKRWAWATILTVLSFCVISNVWQMATSSSETVTYLSPSGVPTTRLGTDFTLFFYVLPFVAVCVGIIAMLLTKKVRAEFETRVSSTPPATRAAAASSAPAPAGDFTRQSEPADRERGWRVGHRGRDNMYYEEWRDGAWHQIEVQGEMLMGRAHHVIYFDSPERWLRHPEWARDRRDEIIARIKSVFSEPDYEHHDPSSASAGAEAVTSASAAPVPSPVSLPAVFAPPKKEAGWLLLGLVLFVGFGGFMLWTVKDGIAHGETFLPSKHSMRHRVKLEDDPAQFWVSIAFNGAIGVLSTGFGFRFLFALARKVPTRKS